MHWVVEIKNSPHFFNYAFFKIKIVKNASPIGIGLKAFLNSFVNKYLFVKRTISLCTG